jgi:hypothetical protein
MEYPLSGFEIPDQGAAVQQKGETLDRARLRWWGKLGTWIGW